MIDQARIYRSLSGHFGLLPTEDQNLLMRELARFLYGRESDVFVIKGYAGTGKTTMVKALVKTLPEMRMRYVLLAPTGKAAKVMSRYTGETAYTIHKKIYRTELRDGLFLRLQVGENLHKNTVFIVDEASMIASGDGITNLLEDLLEYVLTGEGCRLIFIGDTAQLPPVEQPLSLALQEEWLKTMAGTNIPSVTLTTVQRQAEESGILRNATKLREVITRFKDQVATPRELLNAIRFEETSDFKRLSGYDFPDELSGAYGRWGEEEVLVISRSNGAANDLNKQIRARVKFLEEEISGGDKLMVVKNNYYWLEAERKGGKKDGPAFIANGDVIEINRIHKYESRYGMRFADAEVSFVDYPDEHERRVLLLMDTLYTQAPALTQAQQKVFYEMVAEDFPADPVYMRKLKIKQHPYYNALQVKFAYAVTCHKAQGGQWDTVFIDQGRLTEEMFNLEYLRWLYTAITRARTKVCLVNFHPAFFEGIG